MSECPNCKNLVDEGAFCSQCGAALPGPSQVETRAELRAEQTSHLGAPASRGVADLSRMLATPVPPRLWFVIVMLASLGVLLSGVSFYLITQTFQLFGFGSLGISLGLFSLLLLLVPLVFGIGLIYLARRLHQGDRLARLLAVVVCIAVAGATLLTSARDFGWVLSGLLAIATAVLLTVDPVIRGHFSGIDARYATEPIAVVAARTILVVVGVCDTFVGLALLILSPYESSLVLKGIVMLAIAVAVFVLSRRLAVGDTSARVFTTVLAAVYLVLGFFVGHGAPGVIVPIVLAITVVGLLWLPSTSQQYFGEKSPPSIPALVRIDEILTEFSARCGRAFGQ